MDILKMLLPILASLIGGGACGALITQWFQRRRSRIQPIPLIERVNRLVSPDLKGFFLARYVGGGPNPRVEEIKKVREYQFTLRNSSLVHLHDAEVQFEFPSEDVEGRAERTARSRTTPVEVQTGVSSPWKIGFRWRIPEFPPGDSIDFTFRAVDPPSDDYEVALYDGGQVVIEKSKVEPTSTRKFGLSLALNFLIVLSAVEIGSVVKSFVKGTTVVPGRDNTTSSFSVDRVTIVDWAGCSLDFTSSTPRLNPFGPTDQGLWQLTVKVLNMRSQKCFVQIGRSNSVPVALGPGDSRYLLTTYSRAKPREAQLEVLFGPDRPLNKAVVTVFEGDVP